MTDIIDELDRLHAEQHNAALASLAEKQRAIDEAFAILDAGHGMLACREAAHILRPHATKATEANSSATVTGSTPPAADACDTRELVARLAEFIHTRWTKPSSAHDWRADLESIIAAARRGGS